MKSGRNSSVAKVEIKNLRSKMKRFHLFRGDRNRKSNLFGGKNPAKFLPKSIKY